jgi:hypothetical protein
LISPFWDNLHWSIHSTNGNASMAPVDMASNFPSAEQLAHIAWVHDYAMEIEPVMRKQRFDAAFRSTPGQAIMQPNEFYVPDEPKYASPWAQEGIAGVHAVVRVLKESRTKSMVPLPPIKAPIVRVPTEVPSQPGESVTVEYEIHSGTDSELKSEDERGGGRFI